MISTLHKYLTKDLVRTAVMAAVVFTLIMTTFAVIEPLRKQGIGGVQVLQLFWYLLPVMLSLTLPIAAVFSATFIYGRFSMDNELTACRASGISVFVLAKPAIAMGIVVGILNLLLSNWITPSLTRRGARTVRDNLQGLVYQKLKTDNYIDLKDFGSFGSWMLHADGVDEARNELQGVVIVEGGKSGNVTYYAASQASIEFAVNDGVTEVTVMAINPSNGDQEGARMYEMSNLTFGPYPVPMPLEEKAGFHDWGQLNEILANPRASSEVERRLKGIRRALQASYLSEGIRRAVADGRPYELVGEHGDHFTFRAPQAEIRKDTRVALLAEGDRPVIVEIGRDAESVYRQVECREAEISMAGTRTETKVKVVLYDATIRNVDAPDAEPTRNRKFLLDMLTTPPEIRRRQQEVTLEDLWRRPQAFPAVAEDNAKLREFITRKLKPRVLAEIHGRLAYGFGCILLIPIGAALGMIYRGGHILSAFALCCIPAVVLVVLMLMGKQMIGNPNVQNMLYGKAAMWSGVVLLGGLMAYLYGVVLRR